MTNLTKTVYYYPFEVCTTPASRTTGKAFLKSHVPANSKVFSCCACGKTLDVCGCPSTIEEDDERRAEFIRVHDERSQRWSDWWDTEGADAMRKIKAQVAEWRTGEKAA